MLRCARIGGLAILAAILIAPLAATTSHAQTTSFGLFRENSTLPVSQRNCWVQGMVSGQTINGEQLAGNLTQVQAECALRRQVRRHRCARDYVTDTWASRREASDSILSGGSSETPLDCSRQGGD